MAILVGTIHLWSLTGAGASDWIQYDSLAQPTSRFQAGAVWTGTHMFVWGGFDGMGGQNRYTEGSLYDPETDLWQTANTTGGPEGFGEPLMVWTGTEILLWGSNRGYGYNPTLRTWRRLSITNQPLVASGSTAVWTGTEMIIWGGYYQGFIYLNSGGRYNPVTDTWISTSLSNAPQERTYHSAVWTGTHMVIWGGVSTGGPTDARNDGFAYDPAIDSWTPLNNLGAPTGRYNHLAVFGGNKMLVWGGASNSLEVATGGVYDFALNQWSAITESNAPSPTFKHIAVWTGSEMIVSGAESSPDTVGARYNPVTDVWTALPQGGVAASGSVGVWTGTELIRWRGGGARFSPTSNLWTSMKRSSQPGGRHLHSAVWTGDKLIVWGGLGEVATTNGILAGALYDTTSNQWRLISTNGAPSVRRSHAHAWTGSEMIVWGGLYGNVSYSNGARYSPLTDSWSPMSQAGAPASSARNMFTWSGSEFLLLGHRYSPSNDTWTPMNTNGLPASRVGATTVWTGNEAIYWGGRSGANFFKDGARYNPQTDSWTPISAVGAPDARSEHTAVWTGSEMIVWGGRTNANTAVQPGDLSVAVASGGRYDPATDTWMPLDLSGAPVRRYGHSAIWTGNEMIIWGGVVVANFSFYTRGDGARYHPQSDSWTPLSGTGPDARMSHTASWTGSNMLVYGGIWDVDHDDRMGSSDVLFAYTPSNLYADDGIPDTWQFQYFGTNNPTGMALRDADGDGQDNAFEYVAGLIPTDSNSRFHLNILWTNTPADSAAISFSPRFPDREYELLWATELAIPNWMAVTAATTNDAGSIRTVIDSDVADTNRTYRVRITLP
jgi:N-acetylneuraminic acid mutarotase